MKIDPGVPSNSTVVEQSQMKDSGTTKLFSDDKILSKIGTKLTRAIPSVRPCFEIDVSERNMDNFFRFRISRVKSRSIFNECS